MANLTDKQKNLDVNNNDEIDALDLKTLRTSKASPKEQRIREKLSKLVELMVEKELQVYTKDPSINESDGSENYAENVNDIFDDFYLATDNLITQHFGAGDMSKFREMYNLLFLKYQEKINNILK